MFFFSKSYNASMFNSILSYDQALLVSARHLVSPDSARIIQILGELVVFWWAFLLVAIWVYGIYKKNIEFKYAALKIFFLILLVFLVYGIINLGIPQWRPSPADVVGWIKPLIPHPSDNSFPSGHALFSAGLVVGLWKYLKNWQLIVVTVVIALVTTVCRVIGGVHYPWDILWGFVLGGIGAVLLTKVVDQKVFEKKVFPIFIKIAGWIKL